ncbi:MAG: Fic family protein [Bacteroidota bacterium]
MRIYKDLELVEQLGTGIQRILQVYGKECFIITDHFVKVTFPSDTVALKFLQKNKRNEQLTPQVTPQIAEQVAELLMVFKGEHNRQELQNKVNIKDREYFRKEYLQKALNLGLIEMTIPDKPNSKNQKYRLTPLGLNMKKKLRKR